METQQVSISDIAKRNFLNASTFKNQYKEFLSNFREWEKENACKALIYPENMGKNLSIDETAMQNGDLYTIITNKDAKGKKGALVALIEGTKASAVSAALDNIAVAKRFAVREITLDLANTMDWICRTSFPNATKTADRFHFQKIVTESVQEIRIKLRRKAIDEDNEQYKMARKNKEIYKAKTYKNGDTKKQLLARSRYLLFKPENKWTDVQHERASILFETYPEIKIAYNLSMFFRGIFELRTTRENGKLILNKWYQSVKDSSIKELISAANTIKNNEGKILNYFKSRSSNASAESFNAKIKGFRSLLRGVSDIKFFLFRLENFFA